MLARLIYVSMICWLTLSCATASAAHSQTSLVDPSDGQWPSILDLRGGSPVEARLLDDAADGKWHEHTLFAAAAIASGAQTDAEVGTLVNQFASLAHELASRLPDDEAPASRARAVHAFLHRRLLYGGYDLQATEVATVLRSGRYNCVSAVIFYNCLAREAGLEVHATRLPQHTRSALAFGDTRVSVEPTCVDWFSAAAGRRTLANSAIDDRGSTEQDLPVHEELISDVALVAMIYYNRGVEALRRHEYEPAIRLNRIALALDPANVEARGNLLNAINRRALELSARREFAAAAALFDAGLALAPDYRPLRENRALVERHAQRFTELGAKSQ